MAILYTIDFEYKGGTYLAQVEASSPAETLNLWAEQISDEELARWRADRSAITEAFGNETPVPIDDLEGVWCVSRTIGGSSALVNIIATKSKVLSAGLELTLEELRIIQNTLNEVCNGIGLEGEFETRMGSSLEAARALLHRLSRDHNT